MDAREWYIPIVGRGLQRQAHKQVLKALRGQPGRAPAGWRVTAQRSAAAAARRRAQSFGGGPSGL